MENKELLKIDSNELLAEVERRMMLNEKDPQFINFYKDKGTKRCKAGSLCDCEWIWCIGDEMIKDGDYSGFELIPLKVWYKRDFKHKKINWDQYQDLLISKKVRN